VPHGVGEESPRVSITLLYFVLTILYFDPVAINMNDLTNDLKT